MFRRDFGWFECSQVILEGIPLKHILNAILFTDIWWSIHLEGISLNLFGRDLLTDEVC